MVIKWHWLTERTLPSPSITRI